MCALDFMREYPQSLNFKVAERLKTSRPGRSQLEVVLPLLSSDLSVCPKTNAQAYIYLVLSLYDRLGAVLYRSYSYLIVSHTNPCVHLLLLGGLSVYSLTQA